MKILKFIWDKAKAASNIKKHGVSFEEARSIFYDDFAIEFFDNAHSEEKEERFILLGISENLRILTVCHCYREADFVIRIISARKATKNEAKYYRGGI